MQGNLDIADEVLDWLDGSGLRELLPPGQTINLGGPIMYEGVLQKFVMPRGDFDFSVKATWSPSVSRQRPPTHRRARASKGAARTAPA